MKTITSITNIFSLFAITLIFSCSSPQNTAQTKTDVDARLQSQRYTFVAQTVIPTEDARYNPRLMFPQGSNLYQLSSGYDLKVTPDSVTAYLPFYGRSFVAPMNPSEGGIKFTSTNFKYEKRMRKNNHEITITPKDVNDVRTVIINVSSGGYAYVQILSLNRTPIAFNGIIEQ